MASVGIVGGLGPESTIDYYRRILSAWAQISPGTAPSIIIDSLDVLDTTEIHIGAVVERLGKFADLP